MVPKHSNFLGITIKKVICTIAKFLFYFLLKWILILFTTISLQLKFSGKLINNQKSSVFVLLTFGNIKGQAKLFIS